MIIKNLFTPRKRHSDDRVEMTLSDADMAKIKRGKPWSATVTDLQTGRRYRVRGAACLMPRCFCDAVIEKEL